MDAPEPQKQPHRSKTLEDVVLKFIEKNNRWIWAAIALTTLGVVSVMEVV
jgi:hypothetical protein